MALSTRWMLLVTLAIGSIAVACGDDSGGAATTKVNADASTANTTGMVGSACASRDQCPTGNQCRIQQNFGALTTLLGLKGVDAPGGYCSNDCLANSDCGAGAVCLGALSLGQQIKGECRHPCKTDGDCREGYECAAVLASGGDAGAGASTGSIAGFALPSSCQAKPKVQMVTGDVVGKTCVSDADCGGGSCNGTYCSGSCNIKDSSTCGTNAACASVALYGSAGSCEQTCKVDSDCKQYVPGGDVGCVDDGAGHMLCGQKQLPLDPNVVGKPCADANQCGNGSCTKVLGPTNTPAPDGYCTLEGCETGSDCGGGACIGTLPNSRCYATCTADKDCRAGYSCIDRMGPEMKSFKVCGVVPPATDGGVSVTPKADAGVSGLDAGVGDAG